MNKKEKIIKHESQNKSNQAIKANLQRIQVTFSETKRLLEKNLNFDDSIGENFVMLYTKYLLKNLMPLDGVKIEFLEGGEQPPLSDPSSTKVSIHIKLSHKFLEIDDPEYFNEFKNYLCTIAAKMASKLEFEKENNEILDLDDLFYNNENSLEILSSLGAAWTRLLCFITRPEDIKDPSLKLLLEIKKD